MSVYFLVVKGLCSLLIFLEFIISILTVTFHFLYSAFAGLSSICALLFQFFAVFCHLQLGVRQPQAPDHESHLSRAPRTQRASDCFLGQAVSYFSHQQLSYWAAHLSHPLVVSTLTHGYQLQL